MAMGWFRARNRSRCTLTPVNEHSRRRFLRHHGDARARTCCVGEGDRWASDFISIEHARRDQSASRQLPAMRVQRVELASYGYSAITGSPGARQPKPEIMLDGSQRTCAAVAERTHCPHRALDIMFYSFDIRHRLLPIGVCV